MGAQRYFSNQTFRFMKELREDNNRECRDPADALPVRWGGRPLLTLQRRGTRMGIR